ncbi:PREDICTED: VQ motif-containing protein 10-like [Lupinus angustifolius]|uniref:VQ motif-containing protein 10-like n=1 Tax=Lupinus angustifolius TaxID=3871 RepID=UPI00092F707E|nr:PREDICTED: VQ motif-containing protein 10-like [Lupinus angustifolius]
MTSKAPKIVQIETRYIETDAINFKDVVQSLTGKNSSTVWVENGGFVAKKEGTHEHESVSSKRKEGATFDGKNNSVTSSMVLLKNMHSFKDFDGLLSDLPSLEQLLWL